MSRAICIGPDDDIEQRRRDIVAAVEAVDDGAGVILLTDMFGGTPSNLAISIMEQARVEVIAGVNLPMLIKLGAACAARASGDRGHQRPGGRPQIHQRRQHPAQRRQRPRTQMSRPPAGGDPAGGLAPDGVLRLEVTIVNRRGLHARAAARFVKVAEQFAAEVEVAKDDLVVGGTSILGLMMLAAAAGSILELRARGREAEPALEALAALVARGFDED